jgi:lysophospholipase L1-like esterase
MKNILCFGDSNTWGYIPGTEMERFAFEKRWPGILQAKLGADYHIIEEGLCGRTTAFDDPTFLDRNGAKHLPMLLDSHMPLDIVIIMLGTNDLKHYYRFNAYDIAIGAGFLVDIVKQRQPDAKTLLVSPPHAVESPQPFGHKFDGAPEVSLGFAEAFREIAEDQQIGFLDAARVVTCPDTDGVHLDEGNHQALAEAIEAALRLL